jgi:mono/diheme cytochrome c family protein
MLSRQQGQTNILTFRMTAIPCPAHYCFLTGDHPMDKPVVAKATALSIVSALLAQSAAAADATNGERLAERWCAACHVVTTAQRQANADAPPFDEIARRPGFTESGITRFLLDPHAKMPNMGLSRTEAADIAAFISRQR